MTAANGYTAQYEPLLFGSTCSIEETRTGGATTTVITDASGEEVSEFTVDSLTEELEIDVTNTFQVGAVEVRKKVDGDGPDSFDVTLACTQQVDGRMVRIDIPGGADRTLSERDDFSATYPDLPAGAECTLTETDDGGALQTTITPNAGDPEVGVLTVGDGKTAVLDVVNEFDTAVGPGVGPADDPGVVAVDAGTGILPDSDIGRALLALVLVGLALLGTGAVLRTRGPSRSDL